MRSDTPDRPTPLRVLGWILAGVALTAILTLLSFHAQHGNSDGATVVLEGQAIAHGNVLLHHWVLSEDSFWTVDALLYGLAELIVGVHGYLLHVVPALIATSIVLVGITMAERDNSQGHRRIAALVVIIALLTPSAAWAQFYLAGPYHLGTTLYALGVFLLVASRSSWRRDLFASGLVMLGPLGDLQMLSLCVVPLLLAGTVALARQWQLRAGLHYFVVAFGGSMLTLVVRKVAEMIGTFALAPGRSTAGPSLALHNVIPGLRYLGDLIGVSTGPYTPTHLVGALSPIRVVEAVLLALAVIVTLVALLRGLIGAPPAETHTSWRLDDLLLCGALGGFATFSLLAVTGSDAEARYLSPTLIFFTILLARLLARVWVTTSRRTPLLIAGSLLGCGLVAAGGATATATLPPSPMTPLITLLTQHHLTAGIGGYWSSAITTVESNGRVSVRPVVTGATGRIIPFPRQIDRSWFTTTDPTFLLFFDNLAVDGLTRATARRDLGPAAHTYDVGPYRILVYDHSLPIALGGGAHPRRRP